MGLTIFYVSTIKMVYVELKLSVLTIKYAYSANTDPNGSPQFLKWV